jgi:hypothetical protein
MLIVTEETYRDGSVFLGRLSVPLYKAYALLAYVRHRPRFFPGFGIHTYLMWGLLAVIVFSCVRVLGQISRVRTFLVRASGFVIIAGLPLVWLRFPDLAVLPAGKTPWLLFELIVMVAFVFSYQCQRWRMPAEFSFLLLASHFGLWHCLAGWEGPLGLWSSYVLVGVGSGFACGVCVGLLGRPDSPPL